MGRTTIAAVAALSAIGCSSSSAVTPASTDPAPTVPRVFVSLSGSDTNPCTASLPCKSLSSAYRKARPGWVVELAPGAYEDQTLEYDPTKNSSKPVVFQPRTGEVATIPRLDLGQAQFNVRSPKHVALQGLNIGYTVVHDGTGAADITLRDIDGKTFDIAGGEDIRVIRGDFGPCTVPADFPSPCVSRIGGTARRVVVDGARFHDMRSTDLVNHVDGLAIFGGQQIVIRRSRFYRNMITNIRVQNCCGNLLLSDLTLENNWFAPPLQGDEANSIRADGINIDSAVPNLLIRNNSFDERTGPLFAEGVDWSGTNTRVIGNTMRRFGCIAGVTYARNLFIPFSSSIGTNACGPSERRVRSFGYVNPAGFDFHLKSSSPALGSGDSENCPSTDIDGRTRPRELKCDAGADQRRDTVVCVRAPKGSKTVWVSGLWLKERPRPNASPGPCRPTRP